MNTQEEIFQAFSDFGRAKWVNVKFYTAAVNVEPAVICGFRVKSKRRKIILLKAKVVGVFGIMKLKCILMERPL